MNITAALTTLPALEAGRMAEHKHTSAPLPTQENHHTIRAAVYARVSTRAQDADMQMRELREYAQRRGWQIAHEYVDRGVCGAKEQRPALDKLWSDCRKRLIDAVIVYRYDRFARSLRQLVNALCEFESLGIQFVSLHEGVDTSTPNGRLVFGIFASIAEFERELIRPGTLRNCPGQGKGPAPGQAPERS